MKNKLVLLILILTTLAIVGCCSGDNEANPFDVAYNPSRSHKHLVLFGVAATEPEPAVEAEFKQTDGIGTSSLYEIDTEDGTATLIGDIGYRVNAIAYDAHTKKLYGTATGPAEDVVDSIVPNQFISGSQLIEINMNTGAGTLIGETGQQTDCLTFNSSGTLFAWNYNNDGLCTINLTTGIATPLGPSIGTYSNNLGLAFNNSDVLYLIYSYHYAHLATMNQTTGTATLIGSISGLPYSMARNGDFHPVTGEYWGLDATSDYTPTRNLLVIDIGTRTLENTIPTIDNLEAITFGYK
jgi:hypothetical protein